MSNNNYISIDEIIEWMNDRIEYWSKQPGRHKKHIGDYRRAIEILRGKS